ncbi:hypothetical protein DH2020_015703 [Rehmannia glutinosa]|uniref:Copine C-terminal domain-containing protein n=1 Tax=Rehmannia glutinosa TaxID=99300 RepID=A0ABR0WTY7_REHGL
MGNSESSPDDTYDNFSRQPAAYGYRPQSPEHSRSSTHANHQHHPPAPATTSANTNYRKKQHSSYIADNFHSLDEVIDALRAAGLESSNLILGIDFTKSNEWTATTHDQHVFSFYPDHRPCNGFEEALERYKEILPHLNLAGPTSFAPVIDAAVDIVEKSNFQYHVLVIIADGQVTRSPDTLPGRLSPQEQATINSIVAASEYPLSIIFVGVGDGPWDEMQEFDDNIPQRAFDNFQFVNFTKIMSEHMDTAKKESAFALAALMEIPLQYRATLTLQYKEKYNSGPKRKPLPPPREVIEHDNAKKSLPHLTSLEPAESGPSAEQVCPICLTNSKDMAFGCGHLLFGLFSWFCQLNAMKTSREMTLMCR